MGIIAETVDWDERFMQLAEHIATWSKDPSTKIGCVVVGPNREIRATGYNGFPRGIADDDRLLVREHKYPVICHGEENAILQAARTGVSLEGCSLYVNWIPCVKCSRAMIQVGIKTVVARLVGEVPERWAGEFALSSDLLLEAGVTLTILDGPR